LLVRDHSTSSYKVDVGALYSCVDFHYFSLYSLKTWCWVGSREWAVLELVSSSRGLLLVMCIPGSAHRNVTQFPLWSAMTASSGIWQWVQDIIVSMRLAKENK